MLFKSQSHSHSILKDFVKKREQEWKCLSATQKLTGFEEQIETFFLKRKSKMHSWNTLEDRILFMGWFAQWVFWTIQRRCIFEPTALKLPLWMLQKALPASLAKLLVWGELRLASLPTYKYWRKCFPSVELRYSILSTDLKRKIYKHLETLQSSLKNDF